MMTYISKLHLEKHTNDRNISYVRDFSRTFRHFVTKREDAACNRPESFYQRELCRKIFASFLRLLSSRENIFVPIYLRLSPPPFISICLPRGRRARMRNKYKYVEFYTRREHDTFAERS